MSRIPRSSRRAIDRLARGAHAFHRFAHHPLCGEYAGEVVRIGRRARICRGCSLVALGALSGAAAAAVAAASIVHPLGAAAGVLASASLVAFVAPRSAGKLVTRFLPAALAALAMVSAWPVALAGAVLVLFFVRRYRRRGPDRAPCATCPERDGAVPCRGFAPIVRRERAFGRLAAMRFHFEDFRSAGNPP